MFGRQDTPNDVQIADQAIDNAMQAEPASPMTSPEATSVSPDWQHPGTPLGDAQSDKPQDDTAKDQTTDQQADQPTVQPSNATPSPSPRPVNDDKGDGNDDLIDIKQQALGQLQPLVGHLEQTPEEKFRTTMMMIQASDDQSLIRTAYEAAQKIEDEKVRAQALLDVINEINYFTQHQS